MVGRVEELKLVMDKRRRDGWGEMEVAKSAGKGQGNRRQKEKTGRPPRAWRASIRVGLARLVRSIIRGSRALNPIRLISSLACVSK
jgi:hypothetical protein